MNQLRHAKLHLATDLEHAAVFANDIMSVIVKQCVNTLILNCYKLDGGMCTITLFRLKKSTCQPSDPQEHWVASCLFNNTVIISVHLT